MKHDNLPMPPGNLIRPRMVGLPLGDRLAWARRWQHRKKPAAEIAPPFSEEFVTFVKRLL